MAFENYTILQFEKAMFKQDYSEMTKEDFDIVYSEYIDTAGLYESEEFDKMCYINFLHNRNNSLKIGVDLQIKFVNEFGVAYSPAFDFFREKGHILVWRNKEDFLAQLKRVELKEAKYISKLETSIKELMDAREKREKEKDKNQIKKINPRENWIRTINSLGKIGYKIDKRSTTVEDFAYMIKQQSEEYKSIK